MKCIRIDAEGDAALEELEDAAERQDKEQEPSQEPEKTKPSNKKVSDDTMSWSTYQACVGAKLIPFWLEYITKKACTYMR